MDIFTSMTLCEPSNEVDEDCRTAVSSEDGNCGTYMADVEATDLFKNAKEFLSDQERRKNDALLRHCYEKGTVVLGFDGIVGVIQPQPRKPCSLASAEARKNALRLRNIYLDFGEGRTS